MFHFSLFLINRLNKTYKVCKFHFFILVWLLSKDQPELNSGTIHLFCFSKYKNSSIYVDSDLPYLRDGKTISSMFRNASLTYYNTALIISALLLYRKQISESKIIWIKSSLFCFWCLLFINYPRYLAHTLIISVLTGYFIVLVIRKKMFISFTLLNLIISSHNCSNI